MPLGPATVDYDDANRRTRLTLPNGVSTDYSYDRASRLTALSYHGAAGSLGDLTYGYDASGNRVSVGGSLARTLLPDAVLSANYEAGNRQVAFGETAMTYDPNGSLIALTGVSGLTEFGWDARGRLVSVTGPATTTTFRYDAAGRRVERRTDGATATYVYDGTDITQETSGTASVTYLRTLAVDEPLVRSGEFYLRDGLGSAVALTNADGAVTTTYTYAPFGSGEVNGASANPMQFSGRENDGATALYYYRARYYAPALHRFISEDPIGFPDGDLDQYAYARNSPLNFVDPMGTTSWSVADVLILGEEAVRWGRAGAAAAGTAVLTGAASAAAGAAAILIAVFSGGDTSPKCPEKNCEDHFFDCSQSPLGKIKEDGRWNYDRCANCHGLCKGQGGVWPDRLANGKTCRYW